MDDIPPEEMARIRQMSKMFSDAELARLKRIADDDEKREWLMGWLRKFGVWIFGAVAAFAAFRADLQALFNGWVGR